MVAAMQVTAFRRALQRQIRAASLAPTGLASTRDAELSVAGIHVRQFAVLTSNDGQVSGRTPMQRLAEVSKTSWRLQAAVKDAEQSLPTNKGKRFYNRRLVEALEKSDFNRAWGIIETLHRRHPDEVLLWPYTYNLLLRHLCKQQKTLMNANLHRILTLLDVMVDQRCADETSFHVAMAACSRARHLRSARQVLEKMREYGIFPSAKNYGYLINCCARKQGLVDAAERYFDEILLVDGVKPTVLVINAMLRVYSRDSGRSKLMIRLVERARAEFNVVPDVVTARILVYYLLRDGNVASAVKFLHTVEFMFSRDATLHPVMREVANAVIDACRQRKDWNSAEYLLTQLRSITDHGGNDSVRRNIQDTAKLEQFVFARDALSAPLVWSVDEQDRSRMTRSEREASLLMQSRKESYDRALERIDVRSPSKTNYAIQKLSLKLEGKLYALEDMIRAGTVDANDFNAVLAACGRLGRLTDALSVLTKMKQHTHLSPECMPSTWSYNALLNACAVRGNVRQIESIVNEMIENGLLPDQVSMNTVLKAHNKNLKDSCGGSKRERLNTVMQALSFFEWCIEDQKLDPGAATYYSLFRLFATYLEKFNDSSNNDNGNDFNDALEEEDEVLIEGQQEELMTWITDFITTTCRDAPLSSLDVGVFNNAFDYYQRLGNVDESFALFNLMKTRGFLPDETTLGLMFATCASQQQFEVGLKFLDHIMTTDGYQPTLKVLSGAMQLCANSKNPDRALELFRAIETSGAFKLTVETYEPVVFAYARVGNVSRAWDIANEMEEKLGRVSVSVYNRILLACAEAGLPGRALGVLGEMRRRAGVNADVISYNIALEAFVRAGERAAWWRKNRDKWHKEDERFDSDDEEDIDCEDFVFHGNEVASENVKKEGVAKKGSLKTLHSVEDSTTPRDLEPDQRGNGAWARASIINILDEMKRRRLKPDMITYERAIAVCSLNEDPEGVIAIFDRLVNQKAGRQNFELKNGLMTESSISAYLKACSLLQDKDRILGALTLLHDWHTETGQLPPEFVVIQLLDSLESVGEWRRGVRMLPDMHTAFGVHPSVAVFNRVMQMCNRAGEHQLVAPIFATMQDATVYRVYPDTESYIQRIYAEEQRENWVAATDLFIEMQKKCQDENVSHQQLQKIALGRYSLRQAEH
ncbi:unnamed protein product [Phytophthora lilii]|uniref:Unnamed protein product n=1 Tax=Phytophthora lilii TaxID=2077276 RepID=A0A9W6WLY3_9STRA|nr:unnamed protein product [Phytophthora lilii]